LIKVQDLTLEIIACSPTSEAKAFKIVIHHFSFIANQLKEPGSLHRVVRYWHNVPLSESAEKKNDILIDENYISRKNPFLYANDGALGFLNLECIVNGYETPHSSQLNAAKVNQFLEMGFDEKKMIDATSKINVFYINDIEIVKMIVRHWTPWKDFNKFLTADVYISSFEVYLSKNWRKLNRVCVEVLESINQEILTNEKPGNWPAVRQDCQKIVLNLLNYIPTSNEDEDILKYLKEDLESSEDNPEARYSKIVENELKVFSRHDAFYFVIQFWMEPSANVWPFKYWVPKTLFRANLLFFMSFYGIRKVRKCKRASGRVVKFYLF